MTARSRFQNLNNLLAWGFSLQSLQSIGATSGDNLRDRKGALACFVWDRVNRRSLLEVAGDVGANRRLRQ